MAASAWGGLQPYLGVGSGCVPEIKEFPETAGQSFKAGTPVKITTTAGTIEIAEDGTTGFLGIAMETASGTTSAALKVMVCRLNTEVYAYCTSAGTAALANTLTQGVAYDFYIDGDSVFSVDSAATNGPVLIYEEPVFDVNGTSTYWGKFRLLAGQAGNLDEAAA